jgi:hypothetical protein
MKMRPPEFDSLILNSSVAAIKLRKLPHQQKFKFHLDRMT